MNLKQTIFYSGLMRFLLQNNQAYVQKMIQDFLPFAGHYMVSEDDTFFYVSGACTIPSLLRKYCVFDCMKIRKDLLTDPQVQAMKSRINAYSGPIY